MKYATVQRWKDQAQAVSDNTAVTPDDDYRYPELNGCSASGWIRNSETKKIIDRVRACGCFSPMFSQGDTVSNLAKEGKLEIGVYFGPAYPYFEAGMEKFGAKMNPPGIVRLWMKEILKLVPDAYIEKEANTGYWTQERTVVVPIKQWDDGTQWKGYAMSSVRAMFMLLDFAPRAMGSFLAYIELRKRLPKENPWFLFQIAHFIPQCHVYGHHFLKPEAHGKLVEGSGMHADRNTNHVLGQMMGEFPLIPTLDAALKGANETGSVSTGFFGKSDPTKCPDPDATYDEFAEYAEQYLKREKQLL